MGFCDRFRVERVVCDEIFYLSDIETEVEVGEIEVPLNSQIEGLVTVTVLDCEPVVLTDQIQANLSFLIQKEWTITTPEGVEIPLEFAERLPFTVTFRKCDPNNLEEIDPDLLEDLECYVVSVSGMDSIELTPSQGEVGTDEFISATFDEELTIMVKLKIVQERQINIALCPANNQFVIEVSS